MLLLLLQDNGNIIFPSREELRGIMAAVQRVRFEARLPWSIMHIIAIALNENVKLLKIA